MNALATACLFGLAAVPLTATASPAQKRMIVLVHGAFADASSWNKVIALDGDAMRIALIGSTRPERFALESDDSSHAGVS